MLKNIIFDFDDTLTDKRAGVMNLVNDYIKFNEISLNRCIKEFIEELYEGKDKDTSFFTKLFSRHNLEQEINVIDFEKYYWIESPKYFKLRKFTKETIERLKAKGYHLGIITDGKIETQTKKLQTTGINKYIDNILITDMIELNIRKPDERIINYYLETHNLKPSETVYIGDHPIRDIIGMKKLGLKTIWIKNNREWEYTNVKPDHTIIEIKDILTYIE